MHYHGHRKRVREKFLKLVEGNSTYSLTDYELLEIVLFGSKVRGDVKPLAKKLLDKFGSFVDVINQPPKELLKIEDMGEVGVVAIKAIQTASIKLLEGEINSKPVFQSWKALLDYCKASMSKNKIEQFRVFFLDGKNMLIANEVQQEGTINYTAIYPREVLKRSLDLGAASVILAHNHPTGDVRPSKEDIEITKKILEMLKVVEINLHDHIIIGKNDYFSFKAGGLI